MIWPLTYIKGCAPHNFTHITAIWPLPDLC